LVRRHRKSEKKKPKGGLIIPDSAKEKPGDRVGEIVASVAKGGTQGTAVELIEMAVNR